MSIYFTMHNQNPQQRLINQTVEMLRAGKLIAYPTDSGYALGCALGSKDALEMVRKIRKLSSTHPLSLICSDISQVSQYAVVDNNAFYLLRKLTPGPYTFILPATKFVPKLVQGTKRKAVGIRIPDNVIALALVQKMGEAILSSTLWLPEQPSPICDPQEISHGETKCVDLILDGGMGQDLPTTVVDMTGPTPILVRVGAGDPTPFQI